MVSVFFSKSSSVGLRTGQGHYVVFLGKILYHHSASHHPGVQMGTGKFKGPCDGLATHLGRSINNPSCFMLQKAEMCRRDGPFSSCQDFTFLPFAMS